MKMQTLHILFKENFLMDNYLNSSYVILMLFQRLMNVDSEAPNLVAWTMTFYSVFTNGYKHYTNYLCTVKEYSMINNNILLSYMIVCHYSYI